MVSAAVTASREIDLLVLGYMFTARAFLLALHLHGIGSRNKSLSRWAPPANSSRKAIKGPRSPCQRQATSRIIDVAGACLLFSSRPSKRTGARSGTF